MKATRILPIAAIGCLAILLAILSWPSQGPIGDGLGPERAPPPDSPQGRGKGTTSPAQVDAQDRERASIGGAAGRELLVVRAGSGQPVPAARVAWLDVSDRLLGREPGAEDFFDEFWSRRRIGDLLAPEDFRETTDDGGRARVPLPEAGQILVARKGELWGMQMFTASVEGPLVLEVAPDLNLSVRLRSPGGLPLCGVPIGVYEVRHLAQDRRVTTEITGAPDGIARVHHLQAALAPGALQRGTYVSPALPHALRVAESLPPEAQGDLDIDLVLGDHGSLRVRCEDARGEPLEAPARVHLRHRTLAGAWETLDQGWEEWALPVDVAGGLALFPHVGTGLSLECTLERGPGHAIVREVVEGPRLHGEERELVLRCPPPGTAVRCELQRAGGRRLAAGRVQIRLETRAQNANGAGQVEERAWRDARRWTRELEDSGALEVVLTEELDPQEEARLLFELQADGGCTLEGRLALPSPLPGASFEGGVVRLEAHSLVLEGRVLDRAGDPIRGASIAATASDPASRLRHGARSDATGEFRICAAQIAPAYGLSVSAAGFVQEQLEDVRPDAGYLEITLRRESTLAGQVLLDPGCDPQRVCIALRYGAQALSVEAREQDAHSGPGRTRIGPQGAFEWRGLAPGSATVEVALVGESEPISIIEGIPIADEGPSSDPRLSPIDLRGIVRTITLTVLDPRGESVPGARVCITGAESGLYPVHRAVAGRIELLTDAPSLDLLVSAPGYKETYVPGVREDATIRLEDGFPITLELPPEVQLPKGIQLFVALLHGDRLLDEGSEKVRFYEGGEVVAGGPQS